MSLISEQVRRLREFAKTLKYADEYNLVNGAADTIEELSAKLHKSQMERSSQYYNGGWIPVSERLPRASEIVLLSLPEHTMVDGEECSPCVICGHYIGGNSEEWGISDGTTVGYGLVAYKHCKPIAWMPLPEAYQED